MSAQLISSLILVFTIGLMRTVEMTSCQLTDYSSFRQLELAHVQLKQQYQLLQGKLSHLEISYRQNIQKLAKKEGQLQGLLDDHGLLQKKHQQNSAEWQQIQTSVRHFMGQFEYQFESLTLKQTVEELLGIFEDNSGRLVELAHEIKRKDRQYEDSQREMNDELNDLRDDVYRLENDNELLMQRLQKVQRQKMQASIKRENQIIQKEEQESIADDDFALQLLNFEKEYLRTLFARVSTAFKDLSISRGMSEIYSAYEEVIEVYREKLQIQYDLIDIEKEYKSSKSLKSTDAKIADSLLIQMRKQIEQFRGELQKQKAIFNSAQEKLESKMLELTRREKQTEQVRHYSFEIEKNLLKSTRQKSIETKKHTQENFGPEPLELQLPEPENELMREVFRKDRENMEKILKQTRMTYFCSNISN